MTGVGYYDMNWFSDKPNFERVWQAYDLPLLQKVRLFGVGDGGASQYYEDNARCGIGQFVLLDPDIVEEPNIGTQHVYLDDVGRAKVERTANRILRINPDVHVEVCQKSLDE